MTSNRARHALGAFVIAIAFFSATTAQGVGYGAYFEYARGIGQIDLPTVTVPFNEASFDRDSNLYGVGFALDTNVAGDKLFNYRMNIGYEYTSSEILGAGPNTSNGTSNGLNLNNMFGFGVYRGQRARVWLGPSLRLSADFLSGAFPGNDSVDLGVGGGLALGVNLHTGDVGSAALTFGYQYQYVATVPTRDLILIPDETFAGGRHLVSFNLTYFFRSGGDRYKANAGPPK